MKALAEGIASELSIDTGNTIAQGKPLVTLNNERVSKLEVQEITSNLNKQQAELERAQAQLNRQLALLQTVAQDQQNQINLETTEAQDSVAQAESELQGAQARYRIAQSAYKRSQFLRAEGALAQTQLDAATRELEESKHQVESLEARLKSSAFCYRNVSD